jgi:undecaprenyl diphosphate synthase
MDTPKLPQHIAFIMDGNGRWATARGWARLQGHKEGIEAVRRTVKALAELKIPYGTFYAFSTENWQRGAEEVSGLFTLFRTFFKTELPELKKNGVRIKFIGDRTPKSAGGRLDDDIVALMNSVEADTATHGNVTAIFAINYSGRDELTRAAAKLSAHGGALENHLDTAGIPDPDLLIRTSGEQRISNYLLWQLAYTEFYFTPVAWPDFTAEHLNEALAAFGGRLRRFGGLPSA